MQFLQTLKLGRKSTLTGRVHNEHDLVLQLSKVEGFALRHSSFQVIKRHHGVWQKTSERVSQVANAENMAT